MAEFGAAATLELSVSDRELRDARQEIEDGIGDVEVGVSTPPSRRQPSGASAVTDGGFDSVDTLLVAQLEQLEDIHDELEKMGASGGGPGGGGGGGIGGSVLMGLGTRSVLGGAGATIGGTTGIVAGGIMAGGAAVGMAGRNALQDRFPDSFAPPDEAVSGTSYAYTEEGGIGGSAEPFIKPEEIQQSLEGIEFPTLEEPQWIDELTDDFNLNEPKWVESLGEGLKSEPQWISKFNPFSGSGNNTEAWSKVPETQRKRYQNETGSGGVGDITIDIANEFGINPEQLQSELDQAIEEQKQQIIDESVRRVEDLIPDFGGF